MSVKSFKTSGVGVDLAPQGLVLINTTSFSAVASQSINDVFSTTYDTYKILVAGLSSAGGGLQARLRVSGADNSTANSYVGQSITANNTALVGLRTTSNLWRLGGINSSIIGGFSVDLFDPFKATPTGFSNLTCRSDSGAFIDFSVGTHNQTVSYTGFTLIAESGTISGSVTVLAYNR